MRLVRPPANEPEGGEIAYFAHSRDFDWAMFAGRPFRGTHMVRDPRDVVVSGFHYHQWSTEEWLHVPRPELSGRTYQEQLNALPPEEALALEIRRSAGSSIREMGEWDYHQPEFLELRYEDVFGREREAFEKVFRHYGFRPDAAATAAEIADRFSFRQISERQAGEVGGRNHLRSGKPGGWQELFTPEHRRLFDELAGDVVERLGYAGFG
jgi:hypothetical protein